LFLPFHIETVNFLGLFIRLHLFECTISAGLVSIILTTFPERSPPHDITYLQLFPNNPFCLPVYQTYI